MASLSTRRFKLYVSLCLLRYCSFCSSLKSAIALACMLAYNSHPILYGAPFPLLRKRSSPVSPHTQGISISTPSYPNEQPLRAPRILNQDNTPINKLKTAGLTFPTNPSIIFAPSFTSIQRHRTEHNIQTNPTALTQDIEEGVEDQRHVQLLVGLMIRTHRR